MLRSWTAESYQYVTSGPAVRLCSLWAGLHLSMVSACSVTEALILRPMLPCTCGLRRAVAASQTLACKDFFGSSILGAIATGTGPLKVRWSKGLLNVFHDDRQTLVQSINGLGNWQDSVLSWGDRRPAAVPRHPHRRANTTRVNFGGCRTEPGVP